MQSVTVRWVGQSFVPPKCSASMENKPRIRRTKEERKTMVMSFIKKYQSSNNGKFPSLNLTHKEVGGSFYTIREIVRDIIQENKVLGPGNPSSKILNFEYYSEEEVDNGSFLDAQGNKSISAIGNGIDHVLCEIDSSMEQQEVSCEGNIAINKPGAQVMVKTDLNDSWQVKNGETSHGEDSANGSVLHEKLISTVLKESYVHSLTEKMDDTWENDEQRNTEVQPNSPEDIGIQYAKQSLSLHPNVSETFLVKSELMNEDTQNKVSVTTHCFKECTHNLETSVTDNIPGTSMPLTDIVDDQSNCASGHDNHKILTLVDDTLYQVGSAENVVLAVSTASQIPVSAHKMHLSSQPFVKGSVIYSSELETASPNSTFNTSKISSTANKVDVPSILFDKEPFTSSAQLGEIASSGERGIYVAEGKSVDNFVLQTSRFPGPETTENDIQLMDKSSNFVDAVIQSENASSKLLEPVIQEADHSDFKSEKQSDSFTTVNAGGFTRSSNEESTKEPEMLKENPLWTAIKAIVSSFIKFWSE